MQLSHILIYDDIKKTLNQDLHDHKSKELITLAYVIISGFERYIALHVKRSIDAGATRRDILNVIYCIADDPRLFCSILEVLRVLNLHFEKGGKIND